MRIYGGGIQFVHPQCVEETESTIQNTHNIHEDPSVTKRSLEMIELKIFFRKANFFY